MTLHQIVCAGHSLAASLKPLTHHRNLASLTFFYCDYLVDVYLNWLNCFHFLILVAVPLVIVIRCIIFLSSFLDRCYKDAYVNSFFPCTARTWNSLPAECFPLIYDLSGFKSRVNRQLFTMGFSSTAFFYNFHLFLHFLVTPSLVVAVQPCMEWNQFKKIGLSPSFMSSRIVVLD